MNPFSNLPPGCRDSDIPGNRDEDLAPRECRDCAIHLDPDDLDEKGRCEACAADYEAWLAECREKP